jgi:hypothetical protein
MYLEMSQSTFLGGGVLGITNIRLINLKLDIQFWQEGVDGQKITSIFF